MNFANAIETHIEKLVGTLKDEKELKEVLKRKFTKKEYKTFLNKEEGKSFEEICELLNEDMERVQELYKSACKKLNQELMKKELVDL